MEKNIRLLIIISFTGLLTIMASCGGEENTFLDDVENIPIREDLIQLNDFDLSIRRIFTLSEENFMASEHFMVFWGLRLGRLQNEVDIVLQESEKAWNLGVIKHGMKEPPGIETSYQSIVLSGTDIGIPENLGNEVYYDRRHYYISLDVSAFGNSVGGANSGSVLAARQVFRTFLDPLEDPIQLDDYDRWYYHAIPIWMTQNLYTDNVANLDDVAAVALNPHLPIWSYDLLLEITGTPSPLTWSQERRSYGTFILLTYLEENGILTIDEILKPMIETTSSTGMEYLVDAIESKGMDAQQVFADFCNHNATWDYQSHGEEYAKEQEEWANDEVENRLMDNSIISVITSDGTKGWLDSNPSLAPGAWAYNVYKMDVDVTADYDILFEGTRLGSSGSDSNFKVSLVTKNGDSRTYTSLDMSDTQNGSLRLDDLTTGDEVFMVIASVPKIYSGLETFNYRLDVSKVQ